MTANYKWPDEEISSINKYKVVQKVNTYKKGTYHFNDQLSMPDGLIIDGIVIPYSEDNTTDGTKVLLITTQGSYYGRYIITNKSPMSYSYVIPLEGTGATDETSRDYKSWPAAVISQSGKYKVKRGLTVLTIKNGGYVGCDPLQKGSTIEGTIITDPLDAEKSVLKITKITLKNGKDRAIPETGLYVWSKYIEPDLGGTYALEAIPLKVGEEPVIKPINGTAENSTTSNGENVSGVRQEDTAIIDEEPESNDFFLSESTALEDYAIGLSEELRIKSMRGVMGMPQQFLPITDPRLDYNPNKDTGIGEVDQFGRVYSEKIIKNIPLLLMAPGIPKFLNGTEKKQFRNLVGAFDGVNTINNLFDKKSGKFYTLEYRYTEYYYYVNTMLRSAAIFLGIEKEKINGKNLVGEDTDTALWANDWVNETSIGSNNVLYDSSVYNFLKAYANCIAFYADAGNTVDDSFSNNTGDSELKGTIDGLSDKAREMNYFLGTATSSIGFNYDEIKNAGTDLGTIVKNVADQLYLGKYGLGRVVGSASAILAGARIIMPEIWNDSSFSRSYSCSMKLVSPSGDKLSIFMNILVPIYHLLGFTLPREATDQAYISPFLVRAYYKGLFNVDMGIISGLNITKGDEGEWTVDGLPTVANISFDIKDLYSGLYMSKSIAKGQALGILSNIQELDYIANSCGINVNDHEVGRMIKMAGMLTLSGIQDKVTHGIFGNIGQFFNNKVQQIFGVFR